MAVSQPIGDNSRKGAVRRRFPAQNQDEGRRALDAAQQGYGALHGCEQGQVKIQGVRGEASS
jgi:hypothetical protein